MKSLMSVAALALVSACAVQARAEAHSDAPPSVAAVVASEAARIEPPTPAASAGVACDVRVIRTAHGVRLEAIARAANAVRGEYQFVITAQGSGGSSEVTQGGAFELGAGRVSTVGSAEISSRGYRALLTLRDSRGELCRLVRRG